MTSNEFGRRLVREPLVHFLIAGAALFWLFSGSQPDPGERRVLVDERVVAGLVQRYADSFRHAPSRDEIDGMIRDWVQDQVYYREALRLGLDRDDEVVVRRMRRKLEAMAVADAEAAEPSEADLQGLLARNPARYAEDPLISFDQVYLGADTATARTATEPALARLRHGETVVSVPAPLPAHVERAGVEELAGTFGDEFAVGLRDLPLGRWSGPVASGLGLHLVRVTARAAAERPELAKVRQRVENDWRDAAIRKAQADAYARILKGYDVVIENSQ